MAFDRVENLRKFLVRETHVPEHLQYVLSNVNENIWLTDQGRLSEVAPKYYNTKSKGIVIVMQQDIRRNELR